MKITVRKANEIAEKFIGKKMLNCVKMSKEYIFQYDMIGFDPFVAVNIRSGAIRYFTPAENPGKYFRKCKHKEVLG